MPFVFKRDWIHLTFLRSCEFAQAFWQKLNYPHFLRESFNKPLRKWLEVNCNTKIVSNCMGIPWGGVLPMGVRHLWLQRNLCVFKTSSLDTKVTEKCIQSVANFFAIVTWIKLLVSKSIILTAWRKPPKGWAKLNTDGSALGNLGKARGGGLIRDHNGDWIIGFSRSLGSTNSFIAKLWALRDSLILARDLNLNIALLLRWMLWV